MNPLESRARDTYCTCEDTECMMLRHLLDEIDRLRTKNEEQWTYNNPFKELYHKINVDFYKRIWEAVREMKRRGKLCKGKYLLWDSHSPMRTNKRCILPFGHWRHADLGRGKGKER